MKTREKPTFEVARVVTTVTVGDKVYNSKPKGPDNFHTLRAQNYGEGFRQATYGEVVRLAHSAYLNSESPEAQAIIKSNRQSWTSGNTAIQYMPSGIYVIDEPQTADGRIVVASEKDLTARLGSKEVKGVVFSDDGNVRRIGYDFAREWQTPAEIAKNPFAIALTGDEDAPEKMAEILGAIKKKGYVWALGKVSQPEIRVPVLNEYVNRLGLSGDGWDEFDFRYSFGVRSKVSA